MMYLLLCCTLLKTVVALDDINVSIDRLTGDFNVTIGNRIWLRSSYTGLYTNNEWFTTENRSLHLIDSFVKEDSDVLLGRYNQTEFVYQLNFNDHSASVTTIIRQWKSIPAITFHFHSGFADLNNDILLDANQIRTVFPSFCIEQFHDNDHRAYFSYGGMMMGELEKHAGLWTNDTHFIKGGISGGPLIIFDTNSGGQGDSIVLTPFSQFMATSTVVNRNTLQYGFIGSIKSIPTNSTNSFLIYYSSQGINQLMEQWGQLMRKVFNKTDQYRSNDLTINYLGYYTDNGAFYYYKTEVDMNYEQTVINIRDNLTVPIHYIQLDSWWYYKGLGDGVKQWVPRKDIFSGGFYRLDNDLRHFPLSVHNRHWSSDTIYANKYHFAIDKFNLKSLPLSNDSFWIDLFNSSSENFNFVLYEQDWMNHQTIDFLPINENIHLGRQWLLAMGYAADLFDLNIQYSMCLPRHALQSLEVPRVTQTRVSDDYFVHIDRQISQWNIGVSSMLSDALGLAPFKDVFWSNEIQPGSPYKSTAKEISPDREILIATLSTGPVAFGDRIEYADRQRIMKCCREDGLILKPSRPLTMIDLLISDWATHQGIVQGELYSTNTIIDGQTFSIVFASAMRRDYLISPSMIRAPPGLIWSFDNPYDVFYFNDSQPLFVSSKLCNQTSFCLWYSSPIWSLDDSSSTVFALLGEFNKWTFVSRQRFSSFQFNSVDAQIKIFAQGTLNELVDVLIYHSQFQSIIHLHCLISGEDLQVQISINATHVHCL